MQDTMTLDDIRDAFRFFDSWEDKYRFVIDLGKSLPALPDDQRIDAHLVRGCLSQVWLVTRHDAVSGRLEIALDSDTHIVRGLIAIVLAAYAGRTPRAILDFDIDGLFAELDLLSHLSPTRGNGLRAMVARIQDAARACG
ncbi:MAG: SufE family protein [Gammaproteobacteria bacterium]